MHFAAFCETQKQDHVHGAGGGDIPIECHNDHVIIRVGNHFRRDDQWAWIIMQQLSNCAANLMVFATMELGFPANQDQITAVNL